MFKIPVVFGIVGAVAAALVAPGFGVPAARAGSPTPAELIAGTSPRVGAAIAPSTLGLLNGASRESRSRSAKQIHSKPAGSKPPPTYTVHVGGSWIELGGECHPASLTDTEQGTVGHLYCTGTASTQGDVDGLWIEHVDGHLNADGSSYGFIQECFTGYAPADGTKGTLFVDEWYQTNTLLVTQAHALIIGGAGDWAGSTGTYYDHGVDLPPGFGGWEAYWTRPMVTPPSDEVGSLTSADCVAPPPLPSTTASTTRAWNPLELPRLK